MSIEITAPQAAALREVLENRIGNLASEIRHTDSPRVRQELREERDLLRAVVEQLLAPAA
jgi:hypothetical protein